MDTVRFYRNFFTTLCFRRHPVMNSPTESSVWSCFVPNTGPPGYLCFTNTQRFNGLDPSLPFLIPLFQGCAANNYTHHPTSADCLSECLLLYPPSLSPNVTTKYCQSCTLMENCSFLRPSRLDRVVGAREKDVNLF